MNDDTNQDPQSTEFKPPTKPIGRAGAVPMAIVPETMDDIYRMSKVLLASGMAPYHLKKPEEVTVIIMHGLELGMKPMMAVRRIAVIKGTPTIWGDAVPGLCLATGELMDWKEYTTGEGDDKTWHCEVKRKGIASYKHATFSIAQAKKADLWDERPLVRKRVWENRQQVWKDDQPNDSPWFRHTERMMTMRTRVAFRDLFSDVFNGLYIAEELIDKDTQLDESGMKDVTPPKGEGWTSIDNPLGADPKAVQVEPKNGRKERNDHPVDNAAAEQVKTGAPPTADEAEEEERDREAEEEQEGREAAMAQDVADALSAPEEAQEPAKAPEATQAAPKAKDAPAKLQEAPTTPPKGYFQEAMATIANAVDHAKLNTWWRSERQNRRNFCSATELEQLNDAYGNKFIALSTQ